MAKEVARMYSAAAAGPPEGAAPRRWCSVCGLCGALQVRALRVALLHAQVLRGAHGDALPQICGLGKAAR